MKFDPKNEKCRACRIINSLTPKNEEAQKRVLESAISKKPNGSTYVAGLLDNEIRNIARKNGFDVESRDIILQDHQVAHMIRDTKSTRGAALSIDIITKIDTFIKDADAYWDSSHNNIMYVIGASEGDLAKILVQPDYEVKINRKKVKVSFIVTGGIIPEAQVNAPHLKKVKR